MNHSIRVPVIVAGALLVLSAAVPLAQASSGPKWTGEQLTAFSDAIVVGRVVDLRSGWDPTNTIYTYVTIDVSEVLRGSIGAQRITIKQLGGMVDGIGLSVFDQATFERGEEVLLYLEERPRDGSLQTAALSQGKWNIALGPDGARLATRRSTDGSVDRGSLASVRRVVAESGARDTGARVLNTEPADTPSFSAQPFVFMTTPYRYSFSPPVDVQSGGQPGLPGGGFAEINASIARWNAAGSSFRFASGGSTGPRCTTQMRNDRRVTISFMDPCGEIPNSGSTLAIAGSYFQNTGTTVNGQFFRDAIEGFLVNNDGQTALNSLTVSGCFADIQLHELGHVLGLGHTTDSTAIMFASVDPSCRSGAHALAADDIQGLLFIYPSSGGGTVPPAPANVAANVLGSSVTLSWTATAGATAYRLVVTGPGVNFDSNLGALTSVSGTVPPGTYSVQVYSLNAAGQSTTPATTTFTIGGGMVPPPPANVSANVVGRSVTVSWAAAAGASSYRVVATLNGAEVFNANVGNALSVGAASVPSGNYTIRVFSVNSAGQSTTAAMTSFNVQ